MKFKFTVQQYQTDAVKSVTKVFAGQNFASPLSYRRDVPWEPQGSLFATDSLFDDMAVGFSNAPVALDKSTLLKNINKIQSENNIKLSKDVETKGLGACSLDVEMETGTGKTYVYIKTMFELNREYGWTKFIVVVPSIAIREGVKKSFSVTAEHFMEHYGKKARFFVYDSKNLAEIDNFSQSADICVMIINTQAFNASFNADKNKEGRGGDAAARIIFSERDEFGSRLPIEVIAKNRPIIILDEPQKMGGEKTQTALKKFNPLFCLNYSATHKERHNLVYALDAVDAYQKKLVKQIAVKGFDIKNLSGVNRYLFLEEIIISNNSYPVARLEIEVKHQNGIKRETRLVKVSDDIFALSKNLEEYKGYKVSHIDPINNILSFSNGEEIRVGEIRGDISEAALRRAQIKETIRAHFEKEKELFARGIKCLSLFFIDEVAKYRRYDEEGNEVNSEYGKIFEEEYNNILNEYLELIDTPYLNYLQNIETQKTHAGYFSIDKKGRKIDSSVKRGGDESDDISAYDLIMKDKEKLLSFENPVRFIFSHSALREGWDNPNVFQICALKRGGNSPTQKRQEVGRGLRLSVNQEGIRQDKSVLEDDVQNVNKLTVIAADGYRDFIAALQKGITEDLYDRPTEITAAYFAGKTVVVDENSISINDKQAKSIWFYLAQNSYVDEDGHITDKYKSDKATNALAPLADSIKNLGEGVFKLIDGVFDPSILNDMTKNGNVTTVPKDPKDNKNDPNFKKFEKLWNLINHKYAYTVDFDGEELIKKAIARINEKMFVTRLQYTVTTGETKDFTADKLKEGAAFKENKSETKTLDLGANSAVKYDVIGKIASGAKITRKSAAKILAGISPNIFEMLKNNPEEFILKAIKLINEEKATMIVEHIVYNKTEGVYDSNIFFAEKNSEFSKGFKVNKSVQHYITTDGYAKDGDSVERRMANDMETAEEVSVYAKLPRSFKIPTPVGNYSPDWAIVFNEGKVKHIFFIAETKGTMESLSLKPIEQAKIKCAKKLFAALRDDDVVYHEVDGYQSLLDIMEKL